MAELIMSGSGSTIIDEGFQEFQQLGIKNAKRAAGGRSGKIDIPELPIEEPTPPSSPTHYKLNFRTSMGSVRSEFSSKITYDMAKKWGDLLHIIPSTRWCTLEDIVQIVWNAEVRNPFQTLKRSRKQIEDGIGELVAARILLTK